MEANNTEARRAARLKRAFTAEERASLKLLTIVRLIVIAAVIVFLLSRFPDASGLYWSALTLSYAMIGGVQYAIGRSRLNAPWQKYFFIALDLALVTFIILFPNPFIAQAVPLPTLLKFPSFPFLFVVVAIMALTYSPGAVLWAGLAAVAIWGAAILWILSLPDSFSQASLPVYSDLPLPQLLKVYGDPNFVDLGGWIQQTFLMLVFVGILATAVWRAKRLVGRQARAERARANLARYFSPGLIDELTESDEPLGAVREQDIAVLFADIVGFTALSEKARPEEVIGLLRKFHGRMAREVFAHGGTVDKYIGDAIMATFGTPHTGPHDAAHALACARAMLGSVEALNQERNAAGEPPIAIGIGVHYGPVVLGDIGDERRLEYAVIGDTVNVAARLEAMTREVGSPLVVSDDVVERAKLEDEDNSALRDLRRNGSATVRGRAEKVPVWLLGAVGGPTTR